MLMFKKDCMPVDVLPASVSTMEKRGWAVTPTKQPAKKTKAKTTKEEVNNGNS